MHKISATVITCNEEKRIKNCLKSLLWTDEIVVIDSGSTDSTVDICKEFTDRVILNEWLGYGRQKNLCAETASHDWIFNIDADEVASETLQKEIKCLLSFNPESDAYKVLRKNYVNNVWIRHGGWHPDYIARLYNKKKCGFNDALVHESIETNACSCKKLCGHLEHYTYSDLNDYFKRIKKYSSLSAQEMIRKNKKFHCYDLICRPPGNFIKNYFLKMGFLDGYYGLMLAGGYSLYSFQKYSKLKKLGGQ